VKKAVIMHNEISLNPGIDDVDTINQVEAVKKAMNDLGYEPHTVILTDNFGKALTELSEINPLFVFNLVEGINSNNSFSYLGASVLEMSGIPFTGNASLPIALTTDKIFSKELLIKNNLPTPEYFSKEKVCGNFIAAKEYILKITNEDASIGLDENSIKKFETLEKLRIAIDEKQLADNKQYFAETFIDGREINVGIISYGNGVKTLPVAEIKFNYPDEKYKIVDYKAKWIEDSFEYSNTSRSFDFSDDDKDLINKLKDLTIRCWDVFNLYGYARVDFRIDKNNNPYIIEINANPCIAPDGGFEAAMEKMGYTYTESIEKIINSCLIKFGVK